jgi:hypothetical protein
LGFFGKRPERKREKRAGSVYSHGTLNGTELEGRGGALPTWNTFGIWSVAVAVSCADCPRFEAQVYRILQSRLRLWVQHSV